jgi:hypothetical protein
MTVLPGKGWARVWERACDLRSLPLPPKNLKERGDDW